MAVSSFTACIIDAKMYAELCNEDCHIKDFCEHLDLAYQNLKSAQRIAMWKGPISSYFQVVRDMRRIRDNIQASYHDIIERCYRYYYSSISQDLPFTENNFVEEVNYIYTCLNDANCAFVERCRCDLRDLVLTLKEFHAMELNAKIQEEKQRAERELLEKISQEAIQEEERWLRQMKGLNPIKFELSLIDSMEGHQFEYWCADLLKKNGFADVSVTQGSGDQGVDVLAVKDGVKYAIQCKCYHSDLGNSPIQEINTGKIIYKCHVGAVMTNRHFTKGAKDAAEATGVLLWDRETLIEMLNEL